MLLAHGLVFVKSQLRQIAAGSDLSNNSERGRDADDSSPDAGSFSMGSQSAHELSVVLSQVDIWLGCAELLQSLLGSGIGTSPDDIVDQESSGCLCDRLIINAHTVWLYKLARNVKYVSKTDILAISYNCA